MPAKRFTSEQIAAAVAAVLSRSSGESIAATCRRFSVSRASYYRWRALFAVQVVKLVDQRRGDQLQLRRLVGQVRRHEDERRVFKAIIDTMSRVDRQQAAVWAATRFGASQRLLHRTLGVTPRTARRLDRRGDELLRQRICELADAHPAFGYRRIAALLRQEGIVVNPKRVYRLWRGANIYGESRWRRRVRRPRLLTSPLSVAGPNECWSLDIVRFHSRDYRRLEFLSILDDFSRLCLALIAARRIYQYQLRIALTTLFSGGAVPQRLRLDKSAAALVEPLSSLLVEHGVQLQTTAGHSPAENAYVESFHATLAAEFFPLHSFQNVVEAQRLADVWRVYYNERRPHSSLKYQAPAKFLANVPRIPPHG